MQFSLHGTHTLVVLVVSVYFVHIGSSIKYLISKHNPCLSVRVYIEIQCMTQVCQQRNDVSIFSQKNLLSTLNFVFKLRGDSVFNNIQQLISCHDDAVLSIFSLTKPLVSNVNCLYNCLI